MILLTVGEQLLVWNINEPQIDEPQIKIIGMISRLPIGKALLSLKLYEQDFNNHHTETAVTFSLIGYTKIPELTDAQIEAGNMIVIEKLLCKEE